MKIFAINPDNNQGVRECFSARLTDDVKEEWAQVAAERNPHYIYFFEIEQVVK